MEFLTVAGIIALLFGFIAVFSREVLQKLGGALNKPVVVVDERLRVVRIPLGIALILLGGWIISVAFSYPALWYLHLIGIVVLFFGLLYLFVPQWLEVISKFLNQSMLSTDEIIIGTRKTIGVLLILAAIYIFYSVFLIAR